MKAQQVIFTNTPFGPYKVHLESGVQFNHLEQTATFRNADTKKIEKIQIKEIDYIVATIVQ